MKLVRSDSPEVARDIASAGVLACWGSSTLVLVFASLWGLLIALGLGLFVSVHAAVWIGIPLFVALNLFYLWRGRSPRLNWVVAVGAERVYVRLFARRGRKKGDTGEPEIMVFEGSEIAFVSAKTVEVFLYGPKPKTLEWLVISPAEAVAKNVSDHIDPMQPGGSPNLCGIRPIDPTKQVFVGNEEGPLTIEWGFCRPALRAFLQKLTQQRPSVVIAPEEHFELDLNGIWHGAREEPDAEQRQMLDRAMRLGFGSECVQLLSLYRFGTFPSLQKATAYLAEVAQEKGETGKSRGTGANCFAPKLR
jgi:hypothetical protein